MSCLPLAGVLALSLMAGCGSKSEEQENEEETIHDGNVTPGSDGYITGTGDDETMTLGFKSEPSPPAMGANTFHILVKDTDGKPITGFDIQAQVFPPGEPQVDSGQVPTVTEAGDGKYDITGVTFDKAGKWLVKFHVERDEPTFHDHIKFGFNIQ